MTTSKPDRAKKSPPGAASRAKQAAAAARRLAPKKPETVEAGTPADKPGATELYFQNGPDAPYAYHLGTYDSTAEAKADAGLLKERLATSEDAEVWCGQENAPEWVAETVRPYV